MISSFESIKGSYQKLWDELVPAPQHEHELEIIADGLIAHKATYQAVSEKVWEKPDNWFVVALIDQMEGGGGANTYLGNGQSLSRVTSEVPAGRGPFPSFQEGAIDALHIDGLDKVSDWPPAAVGYWLERYNGTGYMDKPIVDPYLASWSNKYTKGKYVADHVYDPEAVSQQPGALTILKVLVKADPSIYPADTQPEVPVPTQAPWPPPPKPVQPAPPVTVQTREGHTMIDITQLEDDVNLGLGMVEKLLPWLSFFIGPQVAALITAAIKAVRAIEAATGVGTMAAVVEATAHVTPGAPNSQALSK